MTGKLARSFGALALTVLALCTSLVATPANAAPSRQAAAVDTRECTDDAYKGRCTAPTAATRNYSSWTSLGGKVGDSYNSADFGIFTCGSSPTLYVSVRGTTGADYLNSRNYSTGQWSGWHPGTTVACRP